MRAVASDTLHPMVSAVVANATNRVPEILSILWDILLDLDDLSASTASVMNLLAEFYSHGISVPTNQEKLTPRLWPMMRHTIFAVRNSALKTLEKLVAFLSPIGDALSSIYQAVLLDQRDEIREVCS